MSRDLNAEIFALTQIDFRKALHELRDWTIKAHTLKAALNYLEEQRKIILAQETINARNERQCAVNAAELYARTSGSFKDIAIEIKLAHQKWAEAEGERKSRELAIDVGRSFLSYEKIAYQNAQNT